MHQWLINNSDLLIASANFTIVLLMAVLASAISYILYTRPKTQHSSLRIVLWGLLIEAVGWFGHRIWWGSWRLVREQEWGQEYDDFFLTHSYVALIFTSIILTGLTVILYPVYRTVTGTNARIAPFALVTAVFWLLFWQLDAKPSLVKTGTFDESRVIIGPLGTEDAIKMPLPDRKGLDNCPPCK